MSLKDKVIAIIGAASGIGLETARLFASKGAKLALADVQEKPLKDLESELRTAGALPHLGHKILRLVGCHRHHRHQTGSVRNTLVLR